MAIACSQRQIGALAQQRLGHGDHVRRELLDACAPFARGVEQAGVGMKLVDQAELVGFGAGQVTPAGKQRERALVAQAAGEQPAVAHLRQQADTPEGGDDARALGDEDQVTGQREGQTHACRRTVYGRDERLVGAGDQAGDGAELQADPAPRLGRAARAVVHHGVGLLGHHAQVPAGREGRVAPGEHDRADRAVGGQLGQSVMQLKREITAERVQTLGVVEGDDRMRALALHDHAALGPAAGRDHRLVAELGHGCSLLFSEGAPTPRDSQRRRDDETDQVARQRTGSSAMP